MGNESWSFWFVFDQLEFFCGMVLTDFLLCFYVIDQPCAVFFCLVI